ncbi:hypothetical protein IWX85_003298 [Polaromonas sp. CG_9.11]|nr:hypothetical protein [Polaromonas sp. CG_9.11]
MGRFFNHMSLPLAKPLRSQSATAGSQMVCARWSFAQPLNLAHPAPVGMRRPGSESQCDIRTGKVIDSSTVREVPPSTHSRARL